MSKRCLKNVFFFLGGGNALLTHAKHIDFKQVIYYTSKNKKNPIEIYYLNINK